VNGHVEKADANFVGGLTFEEIADTNIYIGPYPQLEEDTQAMLEEGVTGVFNVQTDVDINHRGINWPKMLEYYGARNIKAVHFPIHDFNEADLTARLFEGAKCLDDMLNRQGLKVYVHCTAGMGRAPACVLVYLCLFKKVHCWNDIKAVDLFVKQYRKVSTPNLRAVTNVIE
jgi:protein-tyrosine phosphatase